jgi:hypothetical protein
MGSLNRLYPHLLPQDILVWLRFLDKYSDTYHDFEYDIRVGKGRPAPIEYPDNIRQMVHDLSMRRIDVVAHSPRLITIIEVTRQAGLKAVGQMITYPILYRQTFGPTKPLKSLLICEELNPDIEPALRLHHIGWQLFPPPETS